MLDVPVPGCCWSVRRGLCGARLKSAPLVSLHQEAAMQIQQGHLRAGRVRQEMGPHL